MQQIDTRALLSPDRLWTREECLNQDSRVPRAPGVYAWYFRELPPGVPVTDCLQAQGAVLLYVGISPARPVVGGVHSSRQTLRSRIRTHYRGNAAGSTLRLSLGCLLEAELGLRLRQVGQGRRCTFGEGEETLSGWMSRNALVTWLPIDEPWRLEEQLIASVSLPLNLDQNRHHVLHDRLSALRREARRRARMRQADANVT
jgi:hypothetical protein